MIKGQVENLRAKRLGEHRGRWVVWFCGLVFLVALVADTGEPSAKEKSFLWKVRFEQKSLYILGSIHFLNKESYPLNKSIEDAFENSKKLVLEIDFESATPERMQQLMLEKGLYRDSATLQQNLSPDTYSMVALRAKELGLDLRALNPLKPWVVALTMTTLQFQKLGLDPQYGVDRYLAERAKSRSKPTVGLETLEFQLAMLDQLSKHEQELMLREALKELDRLGKGIEQIVRSWKHGDTQALEESLLAGMREFPEVHQKVIVERNRRWLSQIANMLEQGENVLVVVGAAHLVGKDGVIELLKQRGYAVEQL